MIRGRFRSPVLILVFVFHFLAVGLIAVWVAGVSAKSGGPPATSSGVTGTVPNAFFGISVQGFKDAFPLQGGIALRTLGKLSGATWRYIEPSQDCGPDPNSSCYQWGATRNGLEGWVVFGKANGMLLVYDFSSMPTWLCSQNSSGHCTALPTDLTWVRNFATALATKFKGQIKYYETYNEVDGTEWTDTCANLVLFHNTIYNSIKAVDPNASVGAPNMAVQSRATSACATSPTPSGNPSDSAIWLQNFLQTRDSNGNLPSVDTVGVHTHGPFTYPGCSEQTNPSCYARTDYGCDWRVNKLHCAAQPLLTLYNAFRAVMNDNGLSSKPLLVTEGGFGPDDSPAGWCSSSSPYFNTSCLSPIQQVAYIGRWLVLSASTWSDGSGQLASWYSYDIDWGTLDGAHDMNPQNASAYGQMENWLEGAVFQQQCHTSTSSTLFVCDFMNGKGQSAEVVFNDDNGATIQYTPPAWATSYQPLLGSGKSISGGSITIGDTPTLIATSVPASTGQAAIGAVVNAASFQLGALAGGTLFTIFGSNLAPGVASGQTPMPGQLEGVSVTINGVRAAFLYVSPTQINAQIPYGLPPGQASLVLTTSGVTLPPINIQIADSSPALFLRPDSQHAAAQNENFRSNSRSQPAPPGSTLFAYFTGQGALDSPIANGAGAPFEPLSNVPATTTATIGGQPAKVLFCGMTPGMVGLAQANIVVPVLPTGDYPLILTIGEVTTTPALVSIGAAP